MMISPLRNDIVTSGGWETGRAGDAGIKRHRERGAVKERPDGRSTEPNGWYGPRRGAVIGTGESRPAVAPIARSSVLRGNGRSYSRSIQREHAKPASLRSARLDVAAARLGAASARPRPRVRDLPRHGHPARQRPRAG